MRLTPIRTLLGTAVAATAAAAMTLTAPAAVAAPATPAVPATAPSQAASSSATPHFVPGSGAPVVDAAALPASVRPLFTDLSVADGGEWIDGDWTVDVFWGFDYNPASNHLAAYGLLAGNNGGIHVQAEPLNLGDLNGTLASRNANSQTGLLEIDTAVVSCHFPNGVYLSNLHYSIRFPDGQLVSGQQTGQFEASASNICV